MSKRTLRVSLAVVMGSLWSLIFIKWFGPLAIAPGVALAVLILLRPLKTVLDTLRRGRRIHPG